jgi:tRNA threonylcarbamoyladenosine biosynthesis protein TsaE
MTATFTLEEINKVAKEILATPRLKKVITFHATMGVGKTTLIKELVKELGVTGNSSSPTFSLVNEYESETGEPLYHFDLYRINDELEAYDMGIDEYFYSDFWNRPQVQRENKLQAFSTKSPGIILTLLYFSN